MLARQIIPKSCSLRRLLCRSNMAVHRCSRKYTFFTVMLAISTVAASSSDRPATCSSDTVMEGETGVITLSFSQEIQFRIEHRVVFSLRRGYEPVVLACSWLDANSTKECKVENRFRSTFHSNGLVDHNVTLVIPNVTLDLHGTYILNGHFKGSPVPPVNCNLTVLRTEKFTQDCDTIMGRHNSRATQAGCFINCPEVVPIVVVVLVVMVVINSISCVVLFRHRDSVRNCVRRKRHHDNEATDETEAMTDSEDRKESR